MGARDPQARQPGGLAALLRLHGGNLAAFGYIAGEKIIGISKLIRLVRLFARPFTVQEWLGREIADALVEVMDPLGVAVHLEASHLCTQMRGVREEHSQTVTTFWRGALDDDPAIRHAFLRQVEARSLWHLLSAGRSRAGRDPRLAHMLRASLARRSVTSCSPSSATTSGRSSSRACSSRVDRLRTNGS